MEKKIVLTDEDKASLKRVAECGVLELLEKEYDALTMIENNIREFTYNHELKAILIPMIREYENDLLDVIIDKKRKEK